MCRMVNPALELSLSLRFSNATSSLIRSRAVQLSAPNGYRQTGYTRGDSYAIFLHIYAS